MPPDFLFASRLGLPILSTLIASPCSFYASAASHHTSTGYCRGLTLSLFRWRHPEVWTVTQASKYSRTTLVIGSSAFTPAGSRPSWDLYTLAGSAIGVLRHTASKGLLLALSTILYLRSCRNYYPASGHIHSAILGTSFPSRLFEPFCAAGQVKWEMYRRLRVHRTIN